MKVGDTVRVVRPDWGHDVTFVGVVGHITKMCDPLKLATVLIEDDYLSLLPESRQAEGTTLLKFGCLEVIG